MIQDTKEKINMVKDIGKIFNRDMIKTQERRETDIPEGVEIDEDVSLRSSLSRGSTTEALNIVLGGAVVEGKNCWRKNGNSNEGKSGLSMLATYTQVDNDLVLRLTYLEAL